MVCVFVCVCVIFLKLHCRSYFYTCCVCFYLFSFPRVLHPSSVYIFHANKLSVLTLSILNVEYIRLSSCSSRLCVLVCVCVVIFPNLEMPIISFINLFFLSVVCSRILSISHIDLVESTLISANQVDAIFLSV